MNSVRQTLDELAKAEGNVLGVKWELFKQDVKMRATERSSIMKHEQGKEKQELNDLLKELLREECLSPGSFKDDIISLKKRLEALDTDQYQAAIVRARLKRLSEEEVPTKRAVGLEKRYAIKNEISEILHRGTLSSDKENIENAFVEHYKELFSYCAPRSGDFSSVFLPLIPKLADGIKGRLKQPITLGEVEKAIDDLKVRKSPGPGGLGAEFYKVFKDRVAPFLHCVFWEAYRLNVLTPFLATHTVLIPKSEDQVKLRSVGAYRPITLPNVD